MAKKLAVLGAGVAATMIAFSPLAFATDEPDIDDDEKAVIGDVNSPSKQNGLVNTGDLNLLNGTNLCPDVGVGAAVLGAVGGSDKTATVCNSLSGNNND